MISIRLKDKPIYFIMPDYQNGKIYKIVCNVTGLVYIGSTCKTLSQRLSSHFQSYKSFTNGVGHYVTSFLLIENSDYIIQLIENYPCDCKQELLEREK